MTIVCLEQMRRGGVPRSFDETYRWNAVVALRRPRRPASLVRCSKGDQYHAGAVISPMRAGSDGAGGRRVNAVALGVELMSQSLGFKADVPVSAYRGPGGGSLVCMHLGDCN